MRDENAPARRLAQRPWRTGRPAAQPSLDGVTRDVFVLPVEAMRMTAMITSAPTIQTERLTLRGPVAADFEPIARFYADPVRSAGFGGVCCRVIRHGAGLLVASAIGTLRGYGFWTVTMKGDDTPVGICGLWNPEGWPEPEIGLDRL